MNDFQITPNDISFAGTVLTKVCYDAAFRSGWHTELATGLPKVHNIGERIALMHSEIDEAAETTEEQDDAFDAIEELIAEYDDLVAGQTTKACSLMDIHMALSRAMEGARKDKMDDHLPHRKTEEVELADAVIRIFDHAGYRGFNLGAAVSEKLLYNAQRADHKKENRALAHGKKF